MGSLIRFKLRIDGPLIIFNYSDVTPIISMVFSSFFGTYGIANTI